MSGGGGGDAFAEEPEAHENHERYLLTYADMITLLMALFIILFAIGQTDIAKFKRFQTGLQKEFGAPALDGGTGIVNGSQLDVEPERVIALNYANPGLVNPDELGADPPGPIGTQEQVEITEYNADPTAETIETVLQRAGVPKQSYEVDVDDRGVVIRLTTDDVTFASGSAVLRPQSSGALDAVGRALQRVSNEIIVEGHTDDRPMAPPASNWELSASRAATVLRYFAEHFSIDPKHLQLAGYGDTRPVATNDTDEGRLRNRRVEIVIALRPQASEGSNAGGASAVPTLANPAKPAPVDPLAVTRPADRNAPTTTAAKSGH